MDSKWSLCAACLGHKSGARAGRGVGEGGGGVARHEGCTERAGVRVRGRWRGGVKGLT